MVKNITLSFLLVLTLNAWGQDRLVQNPVTPEHLEEIKKDVWTPFMESYRELDAEKLQSIHTADIVRVEVDNGIIEAGDKYLGNLERFFTYVEERERQMDISFTIMTTSIGEGIGYQTGYFRVRSKDKTEDEYTPRGFGFFNVLLKKQEGKWKIAMDSDKPATITNEEFQSSEVLYTLDS